MSSTIVHRDLAQIGVKGTLARERQRRVAAASSIIPPDGVPCVRGVPWSGGAREMDADVTMIIAVTVTTPQPTTIVNTVALIAVSIGITALVIGIPAAAFVVSLVGHGIVGVTKVVSQGAASSVLSAAAAAAHIVAARIVTKIITVTSIASM